MCMFYMHTFTPLECVTHWKRQTQSVPNMYIVVKGPANTIINQTILGSNRRLTFYQQAFCGHTIMVLSSSISTFT